MRAARTPPRGSVRARELQAQVGRAVGEADRLAHRGVARRLDARDDGDVTSMKESRSVVSTVVEVVNADDPRVQAARPGIKAKHDSPQIAIVLPGRSHVTIASVREVEIGVKP